MMAYIVDSQSVGFEIVGQGIQRKLLHQQRNHRQKVEHHRYWLCNKNDPHYLNKITKAKLSK